MMQEAITAAYAPVNGISMYYEIHGSGDIPLVLIHGGGSTIDTTFGEILPLLAAQGKVIAVEMQAHGRSSDREAPESFEQDAADIIGLLDHLGVTKANILGFSDGGCTALELGHSYPGRVHKLIAISCNYLRSGMIDGFFEGLGKATLNDMPEMFRNAFLELTPDRNRLQTMFEKDVTRRLQFRDRDDDYISSIQAPAFIMASDKDVIRLEHIVRIARLLPDSRLVILPGLHGSVLGAIESGPVAQAPEGKTLPAITAGMIAAFLQE
ncbi:alpha/beta fold hydrolase [Taibaiella koreensis]|uniref:alpha/beta fold hydrolase n=1 Tax=Taibaiella koreensis TaxID=1268548 RepID=UPI001F09E2C3|nr:alpha/beta hydrolase [Taibaiella koreensis]